jgi:hypothetical protein
VASQDPPISIAPDTQQPGSIPINTNLLPQTIIAKFPVRIDFLDGNWQQHVEFPVELEGCMNEGNFYAFFPDLVR